MNLKELLIGILTLLPFSSTAMVAKSKQLSSESEKRINDEVSNEIRSMKQLIFGEYQNSASLEAAIANFMHSTGETDLQRAQEATESLVLQMAQMGLISFQGNKIKSSVTSHGPIE